MRAKRCSQLSFCWEATNDEKQKKMENNKSDRNESNFICLENLIGVFQATNFEALIKICRYITKYTRGMDYGYTIFLWNIK